MQFLRLNSIALTVAFTQAAVLPRQETSSPPNTSAATRSYLTSITTLPMPTSVEGNTAYPPSTTSTAIVTPAQTSAFSTPTPSQPFSWNDNASSTNTTAPSANLTTSLGSGLATGLSSSTTNATVAWANSTLSSNSAAVTSFTSSLSNSTGLASVTHTINNATALGTAALSTGSAGTAADQSASRSSGPYANSTTNGLVGGVAATGTAVVVTGLVTANATTSPTASSANSTRAAPVASTSSILQLYLSMPTAVAAKKTQTKEIDLGSNMTLVTDDESSSSSSSAPVALFANSTTTAGVAHATGTGVSNSTMVSVVRASATGNSTLPSASPKPNTNSTSSSTTPLSTGSSTSTPPVANAVDNNGTMFAVSYDGKNGTIIQLVPASASNSTNPLAATGTTAASTASASADLGRREVAAPTDAPITPAAAPKGSWSKLAYARTEYLPRPSRFFSGEGWLRRRA